MRNLLTVSVILLPLLCAGQAMATPVNHAASTSPESGGLALLGGGLVALGLRGTRRKVT